MKLFNTMSRETEELQTLTPGKVKLYTCGLTVYSQPHIGNWVGYIYWDVLVRTLRASGFEVERTQNYTDVGHLVSDDDNGEDKMEKGARAEGLSAWDVAAKYIEIADHEGFEQLGLLRPTHLARATDYITQQIDFVGALQDKGYTYEIPGEGVYFDTSKMQDYGKLARLSIEGLDAGARVSVAGKRNITDFALWKFSPVDKQRDMEWDSPWGKGFPGWHLECSVIARETLGDQIDIHTGGIDHIPVHHTNEIAQTEAVTGQPFARVWLHNNHLKIDGGKMAKSLGNICTLGDITDRGVPLAAFRLMILGKHYRTEGNFTWEILEAAHHRLMGYQEMAVLRWQTQSSGASDTDLFDNSYQQILSALQNDLDTPAALAILGAAADAIKEQGIPLSQLAPFEAWLHKVDDLLGLGLFDTTDITAEQKQLIQDRQAARDAQDWARADELRQQLQHGGIAVRDTPQGSMWYRA